MGDISTSEMIVSEAQIQLNRMNGLLHPPERVRDRNPFSSEEARKVYETGFQQIITITQDALEQMARHEMEDYGVVPYQIDHERKAANLADIFQARLERDQESIYVTVNSSDLQTAVMVARALKPAGKVIFDLDIISKLNSGERIEDPNVKVTLSKARGGITDLAFMALNQEELRDQPLDERMQAGIQIIQGMTSGLYDLSTSFYRRLQAAPENRQGMSTRIRKRDMYVNSKRDLLLNKDQWEIGFEVAAISELRAMLMLQERFLHEQSEGIINDYIIRPGTGNEDVNASTDIVSDVLYADGRRVQTRYQVKSKRPPADISHIPGTVEATLSTNNPHDRIFQSYDLVTNRVRDGENYNQFRDRIEHSRMAGIWGHLTDAVYRDREKGTPIINRIKNKLWPEITGYQAAWIDLVVYT